MLSAHQEQEKNIRNIAIIEKMLSDEENRLLDKSFTDVAIHKVSLQKLPLLVDTHHKSTEELEHESRELRKIFDSSRHAASLFEEGVYFRIIQNQEMGN